jgi:DNA-binding NtrC family response regulator/TolB-like protein/tetratricopeptide (TPR) repeat protein
MGDNRRAMDQIVNELVGVSAKITALRDEMRGLLGQESRLRRLPPVLITGETGAGKGLVARILHRASSRAKAEFVEVNGAAIPEQLLESELFGYERGAFTDARQAKPGLLQVAHRGTLFLDEVGILPLMLQAKLLKALEEQSVRRLGSTRSEAIDIWIISATNADLGAAVRAARFREDLYHRLAVIRLSLPSLRERPEDIEILAEHALARACAAYGLPPRRLSSEALVTLHAHRWPGNVRELNGVIERAVLSSQDAVIGAEALRLDVAAPASADETRGALREEIADLERRRLAEALTRTGWNISRTATELGIARNTLRARIARYGLRAPAHAESGEPRVELPAADPGESPRSRGAATPVLHGRPSLAVLPFRVDGEDESKSYFGDGIVEDIVGSLASLRELLVISRSSTLRYRGGDVDVRVVGRDVGVKYALSGAVRRSGPRMRVSVELAETADGAVVWAQSFDGVSDDLFTLQDQIAARVVNTIAPQVREAELRRALRKRPDSLEAYDCMLRGLALLYRLNPEDFADARTWLEKAIALDPSYAAPYAMLANWHVIQAQQGWSGPDAATNNAEVMRMAMAALQRDSFDAMALALYGHVKSLLRYEFDEAIALFDRALEASPSSAFAWTRSSPTHSYIGATAEAIRRAEEGLRLSPLDPHVFFPHTSLGIAYYVAGEHDEGARWGRKAREENPRYVANLRVLAANLAAAGHTDEAREVGQAMLALAPRFTVGPFVEGYPIRDPGRRDRLARDLRAAGLPG